MRLAIMRNFITIIVLSALAFSGCHKRAIQNGWERDYYDDGRLHSERFYKDGRPYGELFEYFHNGDKSKIVTGINKSEGGFYIEYHFNGQIKVYRSEERRVGE